ncbi:hypothetical protein C8J57DRAFT_1293275 [Mycena rebaudengoi]|nr:hypothetical protein C8J57DRAFT_1293275 [Mycena rebaudengoi]
MSYLAVLKATYSYTPEPEAEDEIEIKEDQILFLKERVDSDWWRVKVKGDSQEDDSPVGLVPAAYVEPADHTSVVKALYDYAAAEPGELSITEDQLLFVYDTEEEWLLVGTDEDGGKAGFVPANYVEETSGEEEPPAAPQIVVPPSPPRPVSTYVDPAARVASTKIKSDDIKTWSVSEVDKKGKKKKGTLGVGNGAVFFASEADKTPVQKWQTIHIQNITVEKSKHIHIDVGGPNPINLHFNVGSKDNADAIVTKLESSKQMSAPSPASSPPPPEASRAETPPRVVTPPREAKKATVHFAPESPTAGTAIYDFTADGADELSVTEGERLTILERDDDEWWKCRNAKGKEGVVPASYIEAAAGSSHKARAAPEPEPEEEEEEEEEEVDDGKAAREAEERAEALRLEKAKEKERAEKERKKLLAQQQAKAAAVAAELERTKRKERKAAAAARAEAEAASPPPSPRPPAEPKKKSEDKPSSSSSRTSLDPAARPPPDRVRVWHDRSGQFRVDAAFLGFHNGKLRLHKTNGVIVEVPAEKMSVEDMEYVERATSKKPRPSQQQQQPPRKFSDDDVPLAIARRASMAAPKKGPTIDWFDFFLSAGCDLDDCTRYSASFERDKIDESILLDITDATMRSLGLREGDIIRVTKAIDKRRPQEKKESDGGPTKPPPNLFTEPGGALKNPRRGRPQPSKSLPPAVDLQAISSVSDQIQRTSSPQVLTPTQASAAAASTPVQPPPRTSSALVPPTSGFGDDAWTNRPASTQPVQPPASATPPSAPPPAAVTAPSATPTNAACRAACPPTSLQMASPRPPKQTRPSRQQTATPPAPSPAINTPPIGYVSGLGMGSSPTPMGQHLNNQRAGILSQPSPQPQAFNNGLSPQPQPYNGPRGPFAPVPANQSLLQPLIPTQTGFNSFIPTRPCHLPIQQPFSAAPTGYPGSQPMAMQAQPTGFPGQQPISFQPTGAPFGGFNNQNNNGFVQSNPTGFAPSPFNNGQPAFNNGQSPFNNPSQFNANGFSSPPPSGTFGAEDNVPQSADRYDALRPNPMVAQATGWGGAGGGYQSGYTGYR